jgi:anion-transporting  ArsA/GET3 family ATPase
MHGRLPGRLQRLSRGGVEQAMEPSAFVALSEKAWQGLFVPRRSSKEEGSLEAIAGRRLVLVTGKGGVGKTAIAAGLATLLARQGKRVLCAEVAPDPSAPSALGDALGGHSPGEEPSRISDQIRAVLLTPSMGHRRFLQDVLPVKVLADAAMRSSAIRKFLSAAPGFADMGVMYRLLDLFRQKRPDGSPEHEVCIVDAPATGHALALAQIPELLARVIPAGPIGKTAREGVALMSDPSQVGAIVVTLPEKLPVTEAEELCSGLAKHKVPLAAVVMNRVPQDPFSAEERSALSPVLEANRALVGTRELSRIDRAHAAVSMMRKSAQAPVAQVLEYATDKGVELTRAVAAALAKPHTPVEAR